MAVLSLVDSLKGDLRFLHEQPCQKKLQVEVRQIQSVVESLADFFIEAGKNELDEEGFRETVNGLGFSENLGNIIYAEYLAQKNILMISLGQTSLHHPQFKNLEWRFETQVSSKLVKKQIQPRVVMRLDLEKGTKTKSICLQSSIQNVIHMSHIMSQALQDSRTQHSKRIQRAIT